MDTNIKTNWLKALRSGFYQQTSHVLRDGYTTSFCCLGVLCDVMGAKWVDSSPYLPDGTTIKPNVEDEVLSQAVLYLVGFSAEMQNKLTVMNDNGKSFEEIADYIEQKL